VQQSEHLLLVHSNLEKHYINQEKFHIFTGYKLQFNTGKTLTEYLVTAQSQVCLIGNPFQPESNKEILFLLRGTDGGNRGDHGIDTALVFDMRTPADLVIPALAPVLAP